MLAVDAVEEAGSGHPGMPMENAAIGYLLWTRFLRHAPHNPRWPNRDRFILSAGHGSLLLYSLLYLTGYDITIDDIKKFRKYGSKTPGHPEYRLTPGVETTTGPLGQGFATGVGMAIAERYLAARYNRNGYQVIDWRVFGIISDGDLMEGVTSEAASLAGHLHLGKLVYFYADNRISIEGRTSLAFSEDVGRRFEAYGWQVLHAEGNNIPGISAAIDEAIISESQPSLIIARTHLGYGSPHKQDTPEAHGTPLGSVEVKLTKEYLGWPLEPAFYVPDEALKEYRKAIEKGKELEKEWLELVEAYSTKYPDSGKEFEKWQKEFQLKNLAQNRTKALAQAQEQNQAHSLVQNQGQDRAQDQALAQEKPLLNNFEKPLSQLSASMETTRQNGKNIATREASGQVLNAIAAFIPHLIGGSADLAPSTGTYMEKLGDFLSETAFGRNLHFGVREHAMGAILNGLALSGLIPFGSTFLIFSDYMRPSIRLAALMGLHVIYVFTHDSIGLGEDGPTHQPIEHLASLRAIPNLIVIRPGDATETVTGWKTALKLNKPVALILSRQKLPVIDRNKYPSPDNLEKGAYILLEKESPDVILIGSGSEVHLCLEAGIILNNSGIAARVVSFPSWELFLGQPKEYKDKVLPPSVKARLIIEAGSSIGWERYAGESGVIMGINQFGASGSGEILFKEFGFTIEDIIKHAKELLHNEK